MNTGIRIGMTMLAFMLGLTLHNAGAGEGYGDKSEHGYSGRGGSHGGHGMAGPHGSTGHFLRHLLAHQKEIGLTGEQVGALKTMQLDLDRTRIKAEADILVAERELAALVEDEKTDLAAIEAKVKQSESMEAVLRVAAIKVKRDAIALLTPEQREKEKAEHAKEMRMMMHEYGGHDKGRMMKGAGDGHGGASKSEPKKADKP